MWFERQQSVCCVHGQDSRMNSTFFCYYFKKVYQESMTTLNGKYYACVVTVWTGSGKYYCSGNDLGNFTRILPEGPQKMANDAWKVFKYVRGSMSFPLSQILQHLFIHSCGLPVFFRSIRVGTHPEGLAALFRQSS